MDNLNSLTMNEIISRFQEWKVLIDNGASIDEMKVKIFALITGCSFETLKIKQGKFYRARKNKGNNLFDNISQLTFPNQEFAIMGRANRVNSPMLYLGFDGRTALFESNLEKDDYVSVGEWEIRYGRELNLMYISSIENLELPMTNHFFKSRNNRLLASGHTKQGIENINVIQRLLDEEYLRTDVQNPEKAYTLSIAITEALLSYDEADGLIYPSIKSKNDINIVLKPERAKKKLKLNKCDFLRIGEIEKLGFYHINTTSKVDYNSGNLTWANKVSGNLNWNYTYQSVQR